MEDSSSEQLVLRSYLGLTANLFNPSLRDEFVHELQLEHEEDFDVPQRLVNAVTKRVFPSEDLGEIKRLLATGVISFSLGQQVDDRSKRKALLVAGVYLFAYSESAFDRDDAVSNLAFAIIAKQAVGFELNEKIIIQEFLYWILNRIEGNGGSGDYPRTACALALSLINQSSSKAFRNESNRFFAQELAVNGENDVKTWSKRPIGQSLVLFQEVCDQLGVSQNSFDFLSPKIS